MELTQIDLHKISLKDAKEMVANSLGDCLAFLETGVYENRVNILNLNFVISKICNTKENSIKMCKFAGEILTKFCEEAIVTLMEIDIEDMFTEYIKTYNNYLFLSKWVSTVFSYIDQYYLQLTKKDNLCTFSFKIFKENLYEVLSEKIRDSILLQFLKFRQKEDIDWKGVKSAIQVILVMGCTSPILLKKVDNRYQWDCQYSLKYYTEFFEQPFLQKTQDYYTRKCKEWIEALGVSGFIQTVQQVIGQEETNFANILPVKTSALLTDVLYRVLIEGSVQQIIMNKQSGFFKMLEAKKYHLLQQVINVYFRVFKFDMLICTELGRYIEETCMKIKNDKKLLKDPVSYITKLLNLAKDILDVIKEILNSRKQFYKQMNNSFRELLSKSENYAICLALYCDYWLRNKIRGLGESQIKSELDLIKQLLQYVSNKDIFVRVYIQYYATRLLEEASLNKDVEESVISILKLECGASNFSKIPKIYNDIELSKDFTNEFKILKIGLQGEFSRPDLDFKILTSGMWSNLKETPLQIDPILGSLSSEFMQYYQSKFQYKTLKWIYTSGFVVLESVSLPKKYSLTVNTHQATILMLYNHHDSLSFEEIVLELGITHSEAEKHLKKLCHPKIKLLLKDASMSPKFKNKEKIKFNIGFKSKVTKLNLLSTRTASKYIQDSNQTCEINDEITKERNLAIESVIIRVMKARKKSSFNTLVEEVLRQTSLFEPSIHLIKSAVENLILREYLSRDPSDRKTLVYIP